MNKVYQAVADCRKTFVEMCYTFTKDINEIDEVVQECIVYFMHMNPQTLKDIYVKDGEKGLIRYGAVVLRRSLTSARSPFYYKYKKYYTHVQDFYETDYTKGRQQTIYNMPEVIEEYKWTKLEEIDQVLDKQTWYDKKIFEIYYSGETLDSLASKTGISRNSLFTTIDKVREILKKELNE